MRYAGPPHFSNELEPNIYGVKQISQGISWRNNASNVLAPFLASPTRDFFVETVISRRGLFGAVSFIIAYRRSIACQLISLAFWQCSATGY